MLEQTESIAGLLFGLFADARVGLVLLDIDRRFVLVNQCAADLHDMPVDEHTGRSLGEVVPDLAPLLEPALERVCRGESVTNIEVERGGKTSLASYYPLRDASGAIGGIGGGVGGISDPRPPRDPRHYPRDKLGGGGGRPPQGGAPAPPGVPRPG